MSKYQKSKARWRRILIMKGDYSKSEVRSLAKEKLKRKKDFYDCGGKIWKNTNNNLLALNKEDDSEKNHDQTNKRDRRETKRKVIKILLAFVAFVGFSIALLTVFFPEEWLPLVEVESVGNGVIGDKNSSSYQLYEIAKIPNSDGGTYFGEVNNVSIKSHNILIEVYFYENNEFKKMRSAKGDPSVKKTELQVEIGETKNGRTEFKVENLPKEAGYIVVEVFITKKQEMIIAHGNNSIVDNFMNEFPNI